jgi:RNA polymerase sigma-70 factor (ECF subfamily)
MATDGQPPPPERPSDLCSLVAAARPGLALPAGFETALRSALEAARAAWPEVELGAEPFVTFVASKLAVDVPAERALSALRADELYLACACARGDARAIAALEPRCASAAGRAVARLGAGAKQKKDDIEQRLRERLLLPRAEVDGRSRPPRIAEFMGRGSLDAWLQVVATRVAIDLLRFSPDGPPLADDDELRDAALGVDGGPELAYFKRHYRDEFRAAFREALAALPDRERTLLRQSALDGLSIDRLAALYRVHRATAARWLEAARRNALAQTRLALGRRLRAGPDELDSVMRFVRNELDVTISSLLREGAKVDPPAAGPGRPGQGGRSR